METSEIHPWLFSVEPFPGESLSHVLGRFRRENKITPTQLGKMTGLGGAIARWEKFYLNPFPSFKELEALAAVLEVEAKRLQEMLPPPGVGMKLKPIRLCGACYAESPCHKIEWQFKTTMFCSQHGLTLLSECPNCKARFKIPALWVDGWCQRCFLPFAEMSNWQKSLSGL